MADSNDERDRRGATVCILTNVSNHFNSHRIISNIAKILERDCLVTVSESSFHKYKNPVLKILSTLRSNLAAMRNVVGTQHVIAHSPVTIHFPVLLFAKAIGREITLIIWDEYPVTLNGKLYDRRLLKRFSDYLENLSISLSSKQIVPSKDFIRPGSLANATYIPFWPQPELDKAQATAFDNEAVKAGPGSPINIAFCGQINPIRGLDKFCLHLQQNCSQNVKLHIFSSSAYQFKSSKIEIVRHGHLPHKDLMKSLAQMDFGLVSLAPEFDQAAFPSKTFDYLAVGLPVLYFGKPLPHYVGTVEKSGVGVDITWLFNIDLREIYLQLCEHSSKRSTFPIEFCIKNSFTKDLYLK